jgi:hypothetical protein
MGKEIWLVEAVKEGWLPTNQIRLFHDMSEAYAFAEKVAVQGGRAKVREYGLQAETLYPRESGINS